MSNDLFHGYGRCVVQTAIGNDLWHEVQTHHVLVSWRIQGDVSMGLSSGFTFTTPLNDAAKKATFRVICFFGPWNFEVAAPFEAAPGAAVRIGPERSEEPAPPQH